MMDSLPAFGDKTRDGGIPFRALQQFHAAIAQVEHGHAHFLVGDGLFRVGALAQKLLKERDSLRQRFHRDAEMMNLHFGAG